MTDYGIEKFVDDNSVYVRQPHCAVEVRVTEAYVEREVFDTIYDVGISSDGEHWQTVYVVGTEDEANLLRDRLAQFINKEAGGE